MRPLAAIALLATLASPVNAQDWRDWNNANPTYGNTTRVTPAPQIPSTPTVTCVPKISVSRLRFARVDGDLRETRTTYTGHHNSTRNSTTWRQTGIKKSYHQAYRPVMDVVNTSRCQVRAIQVQFDAYENGKLVQKANIIQAVDLAPGQRIEVTGDRFSPKSGAYRYMPIPKNLVTDAR